MAQQESRLAGERPPELRIIAANLRRLRVETGEFSQRQMSQKEVAMRAGLGHNAVTNLEKYRDPSVPLDAANEPTVGTLRALAQVFGVGTDELLRYDSRTSWYLSSPSVKLTALPGGKA